MVATRAPVTTALPAGVSSSAAATISPIRTALWATASTGTTATISQSLATSSDRALARRHSGLARTAPSSPPPPMIANIIPTSAEDAPLCFASRIASR